MTSFSLRTVAIPDFGVPLAQPKIPAATYVDRCRRAFDAAGCDWLVVYADREHFGNIAFLTGFEPRFEEALLLLGKNGRTIIVTGNENQSYAVISPLPGLEIMLAQTLSLMGQDRSRRPRLEEVLREAGLAAGDSIGIVGWKYLEPEEWDGESASFFVPAFIVDVLRRIAGDDGTLIEATPVLMHPTDGLASIYDADQIAAFEWAAARASAAVWRILRATRVGDTEYDAVSHLGYAGEPLNAHVMFASASSDAPVIGLRSPSARRLCIDDGVTTAVSYWGGLSARGGLLAAHDPDWLKLARGYFAGLAAWYDAVALGAAGGDVHTRVVDTLAESSLKSALNPGHLTGYREWTHSPIRPGSQEQIRSGMAFQVDIIPVPMALGRSLNCEDAVTFADSDLREELSLKHPEVYGRITARRAFVEKTLGIPLDPSILPMSSTPLCLAPFWLRPDLLFVRD